MSDESKQNLRITAFDRLAESLLKVSLEDALLMVKVDRDFIQNKLDQLINTEWKMKVQGSTKIVGDSCFVNYNLKFDFYLSIKKKIIIHLLKKKSFVEAL